MNTYKKMGEGWGVDPIMGLSLIISNYDARRASARPLSVRFKLRTYN
jgi:hypothetical protein